MPAASAVRLARDCPAGNTLRPNLPEPTCLATAAPQPVRALRPLCPAVLRPSARPLALPVPDENSHAGVGLPHTNELLGRNCSPSCRRLPEQRKIRASPAYTSRDPAPDAGCRMSNPRHLGPEQCPRTARLPQCAWSEEDNTEPPCRDSFAGFQNRSPESAS